MTTDTMTIDTKKVEDRVELHFDSYEDIGEYVEKLSAGSTRVIGNWTFAEILHHLAKTMDISIDGVDFKPNFVFRLMGRFLFKKKFLSKTMPSGFKMPDSMKKDFGPEEGIAFEKAHEHFKKALNRLISDESRVPHTFIGPLTLDEWVKMHCRHSELHLGFIVPEEGIPEES